MKQVFPGIRPRRLGTRGHSRYCYAAMRKTASLPQPQLPHLGDDAKSAQKSRKCLQIERESDLQVSTSVPCDQDSWAIIQSWTEKILHVKVNNVRELAALIKSQKNEDMLETHKKINSNAVLQRDLKEKRFLNDIGPLKKRRKKKRKGSSSSESSTTTATNCNKNSGNQIENLLTLSSKLHLLSEDEQKPKTSFTQYNMLNIKQEIIDLPQQPSFTPIQQHLQHQYQQTPMNLAADKPSSISLTLGRSSVASFTSTTATSTATTTKGVDLSHTIFELSDVMPSVRILTPTTNTNIVSSIKEEVNDDSHAPTIYCKKVLKAHQTKGFWVNTTTNTAKTTTSISPVLPVIDTSITSLPCTSVITDVQSPSQQSFLMGPPQLITNTVSTSPLAVLSDQIHQTGAGIINNVGPKVASRNILLLRAKRQIALAKATATVAAMAATTTSMANSNVVEEATELPENLGLPRERVISICNMDKHELDDYFLPDQEEEETQEDQETELLQYFQAGDAEEKLNDSLDANKRKPTAATSTTIINLNNHNINNINDTTNNNGDNKFFNISKITDNNVKATTQIINNHKDVLPSTDVNEIKQQVFHHNKSMHIATVNTTKPIETITNSISTLFKPTVGSASASLALLSRKHQLKKQQELMNETIQTNKNSTDKNIVNTPNKQLKVHLNNSNNSFVHERNKHCIFVPISLNSASKQKQANNNDMAGNVFLSPRLGSRLLFKQQSLNNDDFSDPMIGASRSKRTFTSMTTSASAPPSPSIFQQREQRGEQLNQQWLQHQNDTATLLNQTSLDFDLFEVNHELQVQQLEQNNFATTLTTNALLDIETQRSQSVPLAQLQRVHSPINRKMNQSTLQKFPSTHDQSKTNLQQTDPGPSALIDDVDYSLILSSPDIISKFDCLTQTHAAATSTTYCSSTASSSGYSSSAYSCNISRSVPSTPLPLQQNLFSTYNVQRKLQNSPTTGMVASDRLPFGNITKSVADSAISRDNKQSIFSNCGLDFSKSMPTTPITTPCFRYSPTEFSREFLLNGNTLDNYPHFSTDSAIMDVEKNSCSLVSVGVNVDSLINGDVVDLETFCNNNNTNDTSAILGDNSLLDDL